MALFDAGTTNYRDDILLPNRLDNSRARELIVAKCTCGYSTSIRNGALTQHFPVIHEGHPAKVKNPFLPGTGLCRYTHRTVTLDAALARDAELTDQERIFRDAVRGNPSCWLGLLDRVELEDLNVGDRIGFTQVVETEDWTRTVHEREGVVKRKGKTFAAIDCVSDALGDAARLTKNDWKNARPRRKD